MLAEERGLPRQGNAHTSFGTQRDRYQKRACFLVRDSLSALTKIFVKI